MENDPMLPMELAPTPSAEPVADAVPAREAERHIALVHVLTPEFVGLDPAEFTDISDEVLERASPDAMRKVLLGVEIDGRSVIGYRTPRGGPKSFGVAVTPREFGLFSRHVDMLAKTARNGTLTARDDRLINATDNPAAKARTEEDLRAAERAALRQVQSKQAKMQQHLDGEIVPRIAIIEKFAEMSRYSNLTRGTETAVRQRFEFLREYVFGDMLDAVGNQKNWKPGQAERAVQILQKRLYVAGAPADRVRSFRAMLRLSEDYYGHKRALVLGRIAESNQYVRSHPEVAADVREIDEQRAAEKAGKLFD